MRYIHFKRISITNFLSIGKKPVEVVFRPGLNIITGKNYDKSDRANGVGKSTIADAVHFALYGSTIRELKKENIVNDQAPDSLCEVELEFAFQENETVNNCKILRTLNPTKCFFYINGEDVTRSGVPQTTEFITKTIKTSSEVFQNSVVMTINSTVPFMAQKKVEKRKFIEGILGLEVFGNMLLLARSDFNEAKKDLTIQEVKYTETERSLADTIKQKENYEVNRKKRFETLQTRKVSSEQDLTRLQNELANSDPVDDAAYKKLELEFKVIEAAEEQAAKVLESVRRAIALAENNIAFNTNSLKKLKKIDSKCPHCGGDLAAAANAQYALDKANYEKEIASSKEELAVHQEAEKPAVVQLNKLKEGTSKITEKLRTFKSRKQEVANLAARIKQTEGWLSQINLDIAQLDKESNEFQSVINEIQERQKAIKTDITSLQEYIDIIENAKFITSEEGVKSFIVKKVLQVLNSRLAVYLKRLESNSMVSFNEFFEETITNERGVGCSYFNFSGAERKAIDLAMLFTFQDIRRAQADVWLNLSIFDELFDSSLDEKGIELVLDILRERVDNYNESIYIISHRKESKKYCVGGEIVFLEKKNGITTRTTNYDAS